MELKAEQFKKRKRKKKDWTIQTNFFTLPSSLILYISRLPPYKFHSLIHHLLKTKVKVLILLADMREGEIIFFCIIQKLLGIWTRDIIDMQWSVIQLNYKNFGKREIFLVVENFNKKCLFIANVLKIIYL